MNIVPSTHEILDQGGIKSSADRERKVKEAQEAVVGLLGRLSALMTSIGEETRERYEHALALREFAESMYLAFGQDLTGDVQEIRFDKMDAYGSYLKSNLLGDNRLRASIEILSKDSPEAQALLGKLESQPATFGIEEGLELLNRLLGVDLSSEYYRNAVGNGLGLAFDQMSETMEDHRITMIGAIREAQQPLRVLQEIIQGQEETLR